MQNLQDNDLDKIFQQASENYRPKYNPAAWEKMEQKIARWRPALARRRYLTYGSILVISLAGMVWQFGEPFAPRDTAKENPAAESRQAPNTNKVRPPDNQQQTPPPVDNPPAATNAAVASDAVAKNVAAPANLESGKADAKAVKTMPARLLEEAARLKPRPSLSPSSGEILPAPVAEKAVKFKPYLSVGLKASPDFSGLGVASFSKSGANYGLGVEWRLSRRLAFSTGFIQAQKTYGVRQDEETSYYGQASSGFRVDGECRLIDIPVNIRYNILTGDRHNIFISTGFSSYIMISEKYDYTYDDEPNNANTVEVENGARHFMGIYNLSFGYEAALGRRWSVTAEPFVKLPLTNIGAADLRLHTSGVFISLNYHFKNR